MKANYSFCRAKTKIACIRLKWTKLLGGLLTMSLMWLQGSSKLKIKQNMKGNYHNFHPTSINQKANRWQVLSSKMLFLEWNIQIHHLKLVIFHWNQAALIMANNLVNLVKNFLKLDQILKDPESAFKRIVATGLCQLSQAWSSTMVTLRIQDLFKLLTVAQAMRLLFQAWIPSYLNLCIKGFLRL